MFWNKPKKTKMYHDSNYNKVVTVQRRFLPFYDDYHYLIIDECVDAETGIKYLGEQPISSEVIDLLKKNKKAWDLLGWDKENG